jgi:outer membrane biosynthesis protein TonB
MSILSSLGGRAIRGMVMVAILALAAGAVAYGTETLVSATSSRGPAGGPVLGGPDGVPAATVEEPMETPEATASPSPSETATPTASPGSVTRHEASETPEPTETPEASETPEPTETPEATETPEPTETPEVEEHHPKPTETPESSGESHDGEHHGGGDGD